MTQANLLSSSTLRYQSTLNNYTINSDDFEEAKMLRQLKIQTLRVNFEDKIIRNLLMIFFKQNLKDRQFINEEKRFIETLNKTNSGLNSRSLSMNRLNMIVS